MVMGEFAAEFALQIVQRGWAFARRKHNDFGFEPVLIGIEANGKNRYLERDDGAQRGGVRIRHLADKCQRDVVILARDRARPFPERK